MSLNRYCANLKISRLHLFLQLIFAPRGNAWKSQHKKKKKGRLWFQGLKRKKKKKKKNPGMVFYFYKVLQQGKSPFPSSTPLLAASAWPLCRCVAGVMIMSEWRAVTGGRGRRGGGSTCKCICIPARLLRGSRARLSDQRGRGDVVCSLIFAYRTFHLLLSEGRWRGFSPVPSSSNTPSPPLWTFPPTPLSIHSEHTRFHSSSFWVTTVGVTIQWLSSGSLPLRLSLRNKHTLPHTHS